MSYIRKRTESMGQGGPQSPDKNGNKTSEGALVVNGPTEGLNIDLSCGESYYSDLYDSNRLKLGIDNEETLTAQANLGSFYFNQGKVDRAENLLKDCYQRRKKCLTSLHKGKCLQF